MSSNILMISNNYEAIFALSQICCQIAHEI